jgi:predicted NUDIX family phosphoesterase
MTSPLILAVQKAPLEHRWPSSGFYRVEQHELIAQLEEAGLWLGPRAHLETDERYWQLIPYVALINNDRVLSYRRSKKGGEKRLEGQWSVGIGGHVELQDIVVGTNRINLSETLMRAAVREVSEELDGVHAERRRWLGVVVDNDAAVGRVHLGIVAEWRAEHREIQSADEAVSDVWFERPNTLYGGDLESWSRMILMEVGWP